MLQCVHLLFKHHIYVIHTHTYIHAYIHTYIESGRSRRRWTRTWWLQMSATELWLAFQTTPTRCSSPGDRKRALKVPCMYVCMYVYIYFSIIVCINSCIYVLMYSMYIYVCVYIVLKCMYVCMYVCENNSICMWELFSMKMFVHYCRGWAGHVSAWVSCTGVAGVAGIRREEKKQTCGIHQPAIVRLGLYSHAYIHTYIFVTLLLYQVCRHIHTCYEWCGPSRSLT